MINDCTTSNCLTPGRRTIQRHRQSHTLNATTLNLVIFGKDGYPRVGPSTGVFFKYPPGYLKKYPGGYLKKTPVLHVGNHLFKNNIYRYLEPTALEIPHRYRKALRHIAKRMLYDSDVIFLMLLAQGSSIQFYQRDAMLARCLVYHKSVFCRNVWTHRASFWHALRIPSTYPTLM